MASLAALAPLSNASASSCVDPDGDGWGWNGSTSCLIDSSNSAAGSSTACVDEDGDGWGWNGVASCRVDTSAGNGTPDEASSANCVDSDGDGWGWNGQTSCRVENASNPVTTPSTCVDDDGDGWGWGPAGSCRVEGSAPVESPSTQPPATQTPATQPPATQTPTSSRMNLSTDLLAAHFDHGPDPDDGHAAAAAYVIGQELGIRLSVVGGTTGVYSASRYLPESERLMRRIWGQNWLDAHNSRSASAEQAARSWVSTMAAGGDVWVAEGGPSDFTAAVVRIIRNQYPEFNTRNRVHVIQHSQWNEDHALREDLNYVRANTDYRRIQDGNDPNATADLRQDGNSAPTRSFVQAARASRYQGVWNHAFDYLDPNEKLDFSDTVEVLYILGIGTGEIRGVNDFAAYFMN